MNFRTDVRVRILRAFIEKMHDIGLPIIAVSIGRQHLHALTELPDDYFQMKNIIGRCKQKASHSVRDVLPGLIWSAGAEFKRINDRDHLHNTYDYIRTRQEPGTIVWSHRTEENWIKTPSLGIVRMGLRRKHLRLDSPDAGV